MRVPLITLSFLALLLPCAGRAAPSIAAAYHFVKAVKNGEDLQANYGSVISPTDAVQLRQFAACKHDELSETAPHKFVVIWFCGSDAIAMEILTEKGQVSRVSTFSVVRGPVKQ